MSVFINEKDTKRVIFNIDFELAERLERAKELSKKIGKKLDVDTPVNKALEKFVKKAEKKIADAEAFDIRISSNVSKSPLARVLAQQELLKARPPLAPNAYSEE